MTIKDWLYVKGGLLPWAGPAVPGTPVIGAATMAAKAGLSDSFIKTLGWWKSSAFSVYIQTPWQQLTGYFVIAHMHS